MPHGRPGDGVKQNSFSLVTLGTPVNFGDPDNDPIDILITLAATDAKAMNESSIVDVVTLLSDERLVERIRAATDRSELEAIFAGIE